MISKIISGGQTGVDRAALDVGLALGLVIGGHCPRGRRAEDGQVPGHYPLIETESSDYRPRTRLNVIDSDATLLLRMGQETPGSTFTAWCCIAFDKTLVEVELEDMSDLGYEYVRDRLSKVVTLNVAGPRESSKPGIYQASLSFLTTLLRG